MASHCMFSPLENPLRGRELDCVLQYTAVTLRKPIFWVIISYRVCFIWIDVTATTSDNRWQVRGHSDDSTSHVVMGDTTSRNGNVEHAYTVDLQWIKEPFVWLKLLLFKYLVPWNLSWVWCQHTFHWNQSCPKWPQEAIPDGTQILRCQLFTLWPPPFLSSYIVWFIAGKWVLGISFYNMRQTFH